MKLLRNAVILVVILGILIAAYVVVSNKKPVNKTDVSSDTTSINILSLNKDKLDKVTIKSNDKLMEFSKAKDKWTLKSPAGVKVNDSELSNLMDSITGLTSSKVIEEKVSDPGKYGFVTPNAEITVSTSENKSQTVDIGKLSETGDNYYLLDKETNKVYVIDKYSGDQIINARYNIKDKTLFSMKAEDATQISMNRGGKPLFTAKIDSNKSWVLTAPLQANANATTMSAIITSMSSLAIDTFVEDNASDLNKYGLANPKYEIEVDTAKDKNKLLLGDTLQGGDQIYAMKEGTRDVFIVAQSGFTFLDKPFNEILDSFVYIPNIDTVSRIDITMDGKTITSTIQTDKGEKADKDKDKFTIDGKDATAKDSNDDQPYRNFYQAVVGILIDSVDIGAVPSGKPEVTIDYTLNVAPGKMKVEFIPKDNEYYYVVKNGVYSNLVVQKAEFDKKEGIRDSYKMLMDFLNKKK